MIIDVRGTEGESQSVVGVFQMLDNIFGMEDLNATDSATTGSASRCSATNHRRQAK